jgi:hypothetical protein
MRRFNVLRHGTPAEVLEVAGGDAPTLDDDERDMLLLNLTERVGRLERAEENRNNQKVDTWTR